MPPGQRWILHLAERTNPRRAPARELRGDFIYFFFRPRHPTVETFPRMLSGIFQSRFQIADGLDINKPVQNTKVENAHPLHKPPSTPSNPCCTNAASSPANAPRALHKSHDATQSLPRVPPAIRRAVRWLRAFPIPPRSIARNAPAKSRRQLDINHVRRKTAELIPSDNVVRRSRVIFFASEPYKTSPATKPKLTRSP